MSTNDNDLLFTALCDAYCSVSSYNERTAGEFADLERELVRALKVVRERKKEGNA